MQGNALRIVAAHLGNFSKKAFVGPSTDGAVAEVELS